MKQHTRTCFIQKHSLKKYLKNSANNFKKLLTEIKLQAARRKFPFSFFSSRYAVRFPQTTFEAKYNEEFDIVLKAIWVIFSFPNFFSCITLEFGKKQQICIQYSKAPPPSPENLSSIASTLIAYYLLNAILASNLKQVNLLYFYYMQH